MQFFRSMMSGFRQRFKHVSPSDLWGDPDAVTELQNEFWGDLDNEPEAWTLDAKGSDVIVKAACDPFDYACRLISGEVLYFRQLHIKGDWLLLEEIYQRSAIHGNPTFERGLEVQRHHIVWIADAPYGS